jgi:hypothetical protein
MLGVPDRNPNIRSMYSRFFEPKSLIFLFFFWFCVDLVDVVFSWMWFFVDLRCLAYSTRPLYCWTNAVT